MKIELRNIKYAAFASQETACYAAAVYIDGRKAGTVENEGHGGPDSFSPQSLQTTLDAYGATLPVIVTDWPDHDDPSKKWEYHPTAESICGALLSDYLTLRDLRRALKSRLVYVKGGAIYQTSKLTPERLALLTSPVELAAYVAKFKIDGPVLNLMPEADALAVYRNPKGV